MVSAGAGAGRDAAPTGRLWPARGPAGPACPWRSGWSRWPGPPPRRRRPRSAATRPRPGTARRPATATPVALGRRPAWPRGLRRAGRPRSGVLSPGRRRVDVRGQRTEQRQRRVVRQFRPGGATRREHVDGFLGPPDLTEIDGLVPGTARCRPPACELQAGCHTGRSGSAPRDHAIDSSTASARSRARARCCATLTAPADIPSTLPVSSADRPVTTRSISSSRR